MLRLSEAIDRSFGLFESSCIHAKVNITLAVRSFVYLVSHKLLLIYVGRVGRVAQAVFKCICYYSPRLKKFVREFEINVRVILIATSLKNIRLEIHSILIGDKKTQLFRGINSDYF